MDYRLGEKRHHPPTEPSRRLARLFACNRVRWFRLPKTMRYTKPTACVKVVKDVSLKTLLKFIDLCSWCRSSILSPLSRPAIILFFVRFLSPFLICVGWGPTAFLKAEMNADSDAEFSWQLPCMPNITAKKYYCIITAILYFGQF